jgi:hypothetical protein
LKARDILHARSCGFGDVFPDQVIASRFGWK